MVRDAHTRLLHGESIPVEITAACFDPGYQLLLTGARNGTLKVGSRSARTLYRSLCTRLFKIRVRRRCGTSTRGYA